MSASPASSPSAFQYVTGKLSRSSTMSGEACTMSGATRLARPATHTTVAPSASP